MPNTTSSPKVLFLSADDFKEKSIQVIRKTPEAYVKDGWQVKYIVARDSSNKGNYFYEEPINPEGIDIKRLEIPLTNILNRVNNKLLIVTLIRIRRYLAIWMLFREGKRYLRRNKMDVIYGYEVPGFLAARLLKKLNLIGTAKLVARFQGVVFVREWLKRSKWHRYFINAETFYALKTTSDLCIMTNDGTQGNWVLKTLSSGHQKNLMFLVNGVDQCPLDSTIKLSIRRELEINDNIFYFISVSRLDDHKRLDRCIKVFGCLVNELKIKNVEYLVIGEGTKRTKFEHLSKELGIADKVHFIGAVNQTYVKYYLDIAQIFMSMYEGSNVGNPLIEAIQSNKLIVTLNNGDTGEWIKHMENGLIYDIDDAEDLQISQIRKIASDIALLMKKRSTAEQLLEELKKTRQQKIWSWQERFKEEIFAVKKLIGY